MLGGVSAVDEAAKTGESVDIALATGTVERVLRDRRLL
jgi:hypothetical protein